MNIDKLIGHTPLIRIKYSYNNAINYVYVKLEYYNYTGSIKDRLAYYLLKKGNIKPNAPIIEATSGNTGISFAAIGKLLGHKVYIFMPDWVSIERVKLLKAFGASVTLISKEEGGFKRAIDETKRLANEIDGYIPDQFNNLNNVLVHYNTTGVEILNDINNHIDAFVSGIGTGGTLMGVGRRLKEYNPNIKVIAIQPESLPILTNENIKGSHKIEGIGDDFVPSIVDKNIIDEIININDEDAINMSRKLASELGLGVGISSGANFLGCVLSNEHKVVTIFADDNKKYLSTDLTKEIDYNPHFISNKIQLLDLDIMKR